MNIQKLIVKGKKYQRTLEFSPELNIISGEKTSGKSLVLSLIDYCLGKSNSISLKVQSELDLNIESIFLEVKINNEIFTISRNIKKNISKFWIYYSSFENVNEFIPEKFEKKDFMSFLMNKLGIIEYIKTKNIAKSNKLTTETISFRDIYRYCFVNQHELGTHNFLAYQESMKRYKNPISFEMIFDLIDFSQNDLQNEIVKIQNIIEQNKKNKENLEGYLVQRETSDFIELMDRIDNLNTKISSLLIKKDELVKNQKNNQEINKNNKDYTLLKRDVQNQENIIQSLNTQINDFSLGITSNEVLLKEYQSELEDIRITQNINYKLQIKDHELTCPLCNSKIKNTFQEEQPEDNFRVIIKDIESKMHMVKEVILTSKNKISNLELQQKKEKRKKEILILALNEFSKDIQIPLLPELNSLNVNISNYEKDLEILLESKRVHNKIAEFIKNIEKDKVKLAELKENLKGMEDKGRKKSNILNELDISYQDNMKKMKYLDLNETFIDHKNYSPYYRGASVYEHESGGLLECMQLSYLNAIISNDNSKFHPKMLLLDSISKYFGTDDNQDVKDTEKINDPEVLLNIFYMLEELSNKSQVIIIENTPPREMLKYVKYTFLSGENGFIDQSKNEIIADS